MGRRSKPIFSKKALINSRPRSDLTPQEIHEAWRKNFFADPGWKDPDNFFHPRRDGLGPSEKRRIRKLLKLESSLSKLCKKFEIKIVNRNETYESRVGGDSLGVAFEGVFNEIRSEVGFLDAIHEGRTRGRVRVVPPFIAKHILVGLVLQEKSVVGRKLMQTFLSLRKEISGELGFRKRFESLFTLKHGAYKGELQCPAILNAVCANRGVAAELSKWAKQQKAYFLDTLEFSGMEKKIKRNPKVRRQIEGEINSAADKIRNSLVDKDK